MIHGITKNELDPSLLEYLQNIAGNNSGGTGSSYFRHLKSNTTISQSTNKVTIGIDGYDKDTDLLLVYKNSVYIENLVDYTISSDSLSITSLDGNWDSNTQFNFICFKNVPELNDYSIDGTKILLKSISLDKLDQILQASIAKADDWDNFKTNGGTIGNSSRTMISHTIASTSTTRGSLPMLNLDIIGTGGAAIFANPYNQVEFRKNGDQNGDLVKLIASDIDLGNVQKSSNGYTKLPNELILQWGEFTINDTATADARYINFPISFPNNCFIVTGNLSTHDGNTNPRSLSYLLWKNNNTNFFFRVMKIGLPYESSASDAKCTWIAIGN